MESSINVVNRQKGLVRSTKEKKSESSSYKQFCTRCGKSPTHDLKTVRLEMLPAISVHDEGTSRDIAGQQTG